MIPPSFMRVQVRNREGRGFGLWLPLFLLWPVAAILALLLAPLLLIAEISLRLARIPVRPCAILGGVAGVLNAMKGLRVNVRSAKDGAVVRVLVV